MPSVQPDLFAPRSAAPAHATPRPAAPDPGLTDRDIITRLAGSAVLAETLLRAYGTAARVLSAEAASLQTIPGMAEPAIAAFVTVRAAVAALLREQVLDRPIVSSWSALLDYLRVTGAHLAVEHVRIIYLDRKNRVIADEPTGRGSVDHCPLYVTEVLRRALELRASALIISHNHPSGDPTPSQADILMTRQLADGAQLLGLVLHDHVIVAAGGHTSFRSAGLL